MFYLMVLDRSQVPKKKENDGHNDVIKKHM